MSLLEHPPHHMPSRPARIGQRIRWTPTVRKPVEGVVVKHARWDEPGGQEGGQVMLIVTDDGKNIAVPVLSSDWELVS